MSGGADDGDSIARASSSDAGVLFAMDDIGGAGSGDAPDAVDEDVPVSSTSSSGSGTHLPPFVSRRL